VLLVSTMLPNALYLVVSDENVNVLANSSSQLNLAIGVKDSSGSLNFKTILIDSGQ
jgi:hypothetical protein